MASPTGVLRVPKDAAVTTAKPAGEPRPRFFYFSVEGQGTADIQERFGDSARDASRWFLKCWEADAARICAALNAAETRVAQSSTCVCGHVSGRHTFGHQCCEVYGCGCAEYRCAAQPGDAPKLTGSQTSADFLATCKANGITMVAMSVEEFQRRFDAALLASRSTAAETRAAQPPFVGDDWGNLVCAKCGAAAQPGDAPKLTLEEFALRLREGRVEAVNGYIFHFLKGEQMLVCRVAADALAPYIASELHALLASRSTPAAPTAKPSSAPAAPATPPYWQCPNNAEHPLRFKFRTLANHASECITCKVDAVFKSKPPSSAPSTEALIAAGDALAKRWRAKAVESREESGRIRRTVMAATEAEVNCIIRAEVWDGCADELEAAVAALHPASEAAKPGPAGKQGG